jgi:phenylpropionate dioxygenase-like ring-hydroxylating dioxygenase large terminal subunit
MTQIGNYTPGEEGLQVFAKPAPGTWTEAFGLGTGPVSLIDNHDREFYELEREAVFRRSWLYMGRMEKLPRTGSYFTKELEFLGVSLLIMRGMDDEVRAFHNVCSHRGNKLMWDDYPNKESSGVCRQVACKYHGWRYGLDGEISYVHNAPEFFDLQAEDLALPKIHCAVWGGFIFVNLLETPRESLREFLTPTVARLETYPFHKMTEIYQVDATIQSNWKVFIDAYQELYHVPYVHSKMNNPNITATGTDKVPFMVPAFVKCGKHRMYSSGGPNANAKVRSSRPLDAVFQSSFYGPVDAPDIGPLGDGVNPAGIDNWGLDNWMLYPNVTIQTWGLNWIIIYEHWPLSADSHRFVWNLCFVPPRNARERLAQEHAVLSVREFVIQDVGSNEAMQRAIKARARDEYYFNDQEVLVRRLHQCVVDDVEAYRNELATQVAVKNGSRR